MIIPYGGLPSLLKNVTKKDNSNVIGARVLKGLQDKFTWTILLSDSCMTIMWSERDMYSKNLVFLLGVNLWITCNLYTCLD